MENYFKHNGYVGTIECSLEDNTLYGTIAGINDLVSYEGETISALKKAFVEAVDDYLAYCKEIGKEPNKPYKGVFNVRTSSQTHKQLADLATRKNMKLNQLANIAFDYLVNNEDKVLAVNG